MAKFDKAYELGADPYLSGMMSRMVHESSKKVAEEIEISARLHVALGFPISKLTVLRRQSDFRFLGIQIAL